jgi:putative spermidine/putrescine transport system permease protein
MMETDQTTILTSDRVCKTMPARHPQGRRAAGLQSYWTTIALGAPTFVLLAIFFVWPIVTIFVHSLTGSADSGWTLHWYSEVFHDRLLLHVIWNTVVIAFWATLFTGFLGITTAYLLSRLRGRLRATLFACITIPFLVSVLVRLFSFTIILGSNGLIDQAFQALGFTPPALIFNTTGTVIGMVNYLLPYMIFMLYSGMVNVNHELLTAARSLGASHRQSMIWVYLPLVLPTLVSAFLLILVMGLGFFLTPAILGGPSDIVAAVYIQQQITVFHWSEASAIGIVLLTVVLIGYFLTLRFSGVSRVGSFAAGAGSKGGASQQEPLRWSLFSVLLWSALACTFVVLILPLIVAVGASFNTIPLILFPPRGFTLKWYAAVFQDPIWVNAIAKSVGVAAATATLTVVLSLSYGRLIMRSKSQAFKSWLMAIAYSPLVVPLILLSIGNFDVQIILGLIGTWPGLVCIHFVIAFPFGVAIIVAALGSVDPDFEKAAWTLGVKPLKAFWHVVVLGMIPSLIGAWLVCFLVSWDEVVIALFQTEFSKTLPVVIYSYLKSGIVPTVPAVAAMLIALIVCAAGARALTVQLRGTARRRRGIYSA